MLKTLAFAMTCILASTGNSALATENILLIAQSDVPAASAPAVSHPAAKSKPKKNKNTATAVPSAPVKPAAPGLNPVVRPPLAGVVPNVDEKDIDYKQGNTVLQGFLAMPKNIPTGKKLPAVVVVHEWDGLGYYVRRRARMLAQLGYIAFAADIYGKGVHPKNPEESGKLATEYKNNRPLMRARARAALDYVSHLPQVNPTRIAAMGYCFGGTVALELGRSGAPLRGIVTFHGGLQTPTPADAKNIKGKVLVLHGEADPLVSPAEVAAFDKEMHLGRVDYKIIKYPGAVHAFTNPAHPYVAGQPIGYNADADHKSWEEMRKFFASVLK